MAFMEMRRAISRVNLKFSGSRAKQESADLKCPQVKSKIYKKGAYLDISW